MHFFYERRGSGASVSSSRIKDRRERANGYRGLRRLQAIAAIGCLLLSTAPQYALAQQTGAAPAQTGAAPAPVSAPSPANAPGSMIDLHPTSRDFRVPRGYWKNPFAPYTPTTVEPAVTTNSPRLEDLAKGGKIYLSVGEAVILALENNYDIAIQRYNLDIADTDILRARSGAATLLGAPSGVVENTLGGGNLLLQASGGGPGGTSAGPSGAGAGTSGLTLTTSGLGPSPEVLDPVLTGTLQLQRATTPQASALAGPVVTTNTDEYNFQYNQGFITGTQLNVTFDNSRVTTNQAFAIYSPQLSSSWSATLTQHLAYGFG